MKMKNKALLVIPLLLMCTIFIAGASPMKANPFNLNTELTLTHNYNPDILAFWEKYAQSHYFQGTDNKRIHSVSIKNGNNKVVLISQGRNESVLKYKEVAYDLHQQGYDIFIMDHRGQGFSERLGGDQYRGHVEHFQDYVDDLNQYVNSLALHDTYTERYLISHSMGGAISALYLQQYKHPFQASVFFSPMLSINLGSLSPFVAKIIGYTSAKICSWFSDLACYMPGGKAYQQRSFANNSFTHSETRFTSSQVGLKEFPVTQLGDATMRWVATSITATERAINNAEKINIPILVIQAGEDDIVTATGQIDFFNNLPNCTSNDFLVLKDAKHEIFLESDELRLAALTHSLKFLTATAKGERTCTK